MIEQIKFLTLNLSSILNLILVVKSDTKFTLSKLLFLNQNKELIFFISFDIILYLEASSALGGFYMNFQKLEEASSVFVEI